MIHFIYPFSLSAFAITGSFVLTFCNYFKFITTLHLNFLFKYLDLALFVIIDHIFWKFTRVTLLSLMIFASTSAIVYLFGH